MSVSYSTAINVIAILSTTSAVVYTIYISLYNRICDAEDARVLIFVFGGTLLLFIPTVANSGTDKVSNNPSTSTNPLVLAFEFWWGGIILPLGKWLPVEVSVIAMVGGLLYAILQYEGFTTG
jgi:hypothetical protein